MRREDALEAIMEEYKDAYKKWKPHKSPHDGWAKIFEEVMELFGAIHEDQEDIRPMRVEATQIAAMAMRFLVDLC